jgi:hypothetical protein
MGAVATCHLFARGWVPGARGRIAYLVGCVDGREGALEAAHLLAAGIGVGVGVEAAAKQVVVAVFDCCQLVVLRGKLVGIVAEKGALTGEEVVFGGIGCDVEVGGVTAGLALAWGGSAMCPEVHRGSSGAAYQRRTRRGRGTGRPWRAWRCGDAMELTGVWGVENLGLEVQPSRRRTEMNGGNVYGDAVGRCRHRPAAMYASPSRRRPVALDSQLFPVHQHPRPR